MNTDNCHQNKGLPRREGILKFMRRCHEVTERIMTCFAVGLGLPEDYFKDLMDPKHEDCGTVSTQKIENWSTAVKLCLLT